MLRILTLLAVMSFLSHGETGNGFVRINLGSAGCAAPWMNHNHSSGTAVNLKDSAIQLIGATVTQNGTNAGGMSTGGATGSTIAPNCATQSFGYISGTVGNSISWTIAGLSDANTYDIKAFSSRLGATGSVGAWTISGTTVLLTATDNVSNEAAFNGVSPSGGAITITLSIPPENTHGSKYTYYNYLKIFRVGAVEPAVARREVRWED
jgi:hypothetical protein